MRPDSLDPEARSSALEELARQAIDGDREALEGLVRLLQADIYGLSLRMLWNREDAEDATQEILVRIVTRPSQLDFRSRLKTWAYRVSASSGSPGTSPRINRLSAMPPAGARPSRSSRTRGLR